MLSKNKLILVILILSSHLSVSQSHFPEKNNPKIKAPTVVPIRAFAIHPSQIKLLEGSIFKHAQDLDSTYLVSIDPYRLLHRFYTKAGLPTKGEVYGGWESDGVIRPL